MLVFKVFLLLQTHKCTYICTRYHVIIYNLLLTIYQSMVYDNHEYKYMHMTRVHMFNISITYRNDEWKKTTSMGGGYYLLCKLRGIGKFWNIMSQKMPDYLLSNETFISFEYIIQWISSFVYPNNWKYWIFANLLWIIEEKPCASIHQLFKQTLAVVETATRGRRGLFLQQNRPHTRHVLGALGRLGVELAQARNVLPLLTGLHGITLLQKLLLGESALKKFNLHWERQFSIEK